MKRFSTQSEVIFHKYREKVFGFFIDFLNDRELARDLTQDIFVKLLLREKDIANLDDVDGYLYQMCRNLVFDQFKKAAYNKAYRDHIIEVNTGDHPSINPEIYRKINTDHHRHLLEKYLSKLPDQQRIVFILSKKEGLSNKGIAAQLNISPHTVRNHLYQAMKNLRADISPSDIELVILFSVNYWII